MRGIHVRRPCRPRDELSRYPGEAQLTMPQMGPGFTAPVTASPGALRKAIPLRQWDGKHGAPDAWDPERVRLVRQRWDRQTSALLHRDRVVEESIRMLAGRQWDQWSPVLGQFIDPTRYMSDSEKRWRQRPVVNVLQYWFLLTHARVTETPPIITFQPATADRKDANLAEVMDIIFKTLWQGDLDMDDVVLRAAAWLIAAGETYLETSAYYDAASPQYALSAPATLSLARPDGSSIERDTGPVPYGASGNPLASLVHQGGDEYGYDVPDFGDGYSGEQPATAQEGCPLVSVYSPLEVRSEWGANIPWIRKRWINVRKYLTPEEVRDTYGVEVKPDTFGTTGDLSGGAGALQRILFGAGNFGSVSNNVISDDRSALEGFVTVDTMWEKPDSQISPASEESPGGRLLITATYGGVVLHDSVRPYKTAAAGPIRRAQFIQQPGRGGFGSTPLEQMTPVQKTYNRGWAQILEHRNRCTNPILIYDQDSGFADQASNLPGAMVAADFAATQGRPPAAYLAPPPLSEDVWRIQGMLFDLLMRLGSISGSEGTPPSDDPSGELIAQLRFNSDRPVAVAVRSLAYALSGVGDDLVAVLPSCWPAEKVISYAGEDNVLRTMQVMPEMWEGRVNVRPDIMSAVPESAPAKQAKLERWFQLGILGDPMSQGRKTFLEMVNYPNISRITRADGGIDKITCERMLSELSNGQANAASLSLLPQYNYDVFLSTTRDYMAAPEFREIDPMLQEEFMQFWMKLTTARVQAMQMMAATVAAPTMQIAGALQGSAESAHAATAPQEPNTEGEGTPGTSGGGGSMTSGPNTSGPDVPS